MPASSDIAIQEAATSEHIEAVRVLIREYAASLDIDLCFQGLSEELAQLPGAYVPPRGRLLLAVGAEGQAGCVALRPLTDQVCEMKRLYVRPHCRGRGLGTALAQRVILEAQAAGYSTMLLDTLASMQTAIRIYRALGFRPRPAYHPTPLPHTVFLERRL